jgi:hypothetical protein
MLAYAIQPSIVSPSHYTGEPNHVSDTEQTKVLDSKTLNTSNHMNEEENTGDFGLKLDSNENIAHLEL